MSANDPPKKHRKQAKTTPKTRVFTLSWDKPLPIRLGLALPKRQPHCRNFRGSGKARA